MTHRGPFQPQTFCDSVTKPTESLHGLMICSSNGWPKGLEIWITNQNFDVVTLSQVTAGAEKQRLPREVLALLCLLHPGFLNSWHSRVC